jgi:hypothetical protein
MLEEFIKSYKLYVLSRYKTRKMSSDQDREIESHVDHFLNGTTNEMVRKQVIDTLASYGIRAIDPIKRVISDPSIQKDEGLRLYGLEKIKLIEESA